jgi:hypothetical protein
MDRDEELFAFLDDLEQQAEAAYDLDRAAELADRGRAEYAAVPLATRLMASVDAEVTLEVVGVGALTGVLQRVATGWCLLRGPAQDWVVRTSAVHVVHAASDRSVPELAWPAVTRLGLGSALRRISGSGQWCVVHTTTGARHDGVLRRVGQDFVEVVTTADRTVLVAFTAIAAVQSRG